ncbi:MAG: MmgE/PrpD family protein [Bifidobacteriaceae bacterium]|jgi:2-methylcitrate dehydratase PrpD|nr:MmgE/PrpD family protein [Bifidobacteriaceae bacterium]
MATSSSASTPISVADVAARWAASVDWDHVPSLVKSELIKGLVQSITGGIAGFDVPETLVAVEIARSERGSGPCTILVHGDAVPPSTAAFVNSVMFCALEQQEMHAESATHPFETVVPTALALAEANQATGRCFLEAVLVGFETMVVFAQAAQRYMAQTSPGTCLGASVHGALGAAATAARLLGLDATGIALAVAHAANFASGLNESNLLGFTEYHYSLANASRVGLLGAQLAAAGAEASPTTFDGPAGYFHRFAEIAATGDKGAELSAFVADRLGRHWAVPETLYKTYPVHFYNLPYVDGAKLLRERHMIEPREIQSVRVFLNHWCEWCFGQDLGPYTRRESTRGATAFGISSMLARGHFDLQDAADPSAPDIAAIASKTSVKVFENESLADRWQSVRIEVLTAKGEFVYDSRVDGIDDYRLPRPRVDAIARDVLGRALPCLPAQSIIDRIASLEHSADVKSLIKQLTPQASPRKASSHESS